MCAHEHMDLIGGMGDAPVGGNDFVQVSDEAGLARELQAFIAKNPQIFGGADIYNLDFRTPPARAGVLACVPTGVIDTQQRSVVHKYVILLPSGSDAGACGNEAWTQMLATFGLLTGRELEPHEQAILRSRFRVLVASDRRSRAVLDIIAAQPERTVVLVTDAAIYRDDRVEPYIAPDCFTPTRPEDLVSLVHRGAAVEWLSRWRMGALLGLGR